MQNNLGLNRTRGRSSFEIIYIILDYCRQPRSISATMQKAKLRNQRGIPLRKLLFHYGLLQRVLGDNERLLLQTTTRGLLYLEFFGKTMGLVEVSIE